MVKQKERKYGHEEATIHRKNVNETHRQIERKKSKRED